MEIIFCWCGGAKVILVVPHHFSSASSVPSISHRNCGSAPVRKCPPLHLEGLEGWYRGQEVNMWSAVCSSALHLQFAEGTKPHLCIVEHNSPTPVCRRFSLTQEGLGRVIPSSEGPGDGINVWKREVFFCHSVFHLWSARFFFIAVVSKLVQNDFRISLI